MTEQHIGFGFVVLVSWVMIGATIYFANKKHNK